MVCSSGPGSLSSCSFVPTAVLFLNLALEGQEMRKIFDFVRKCCSRECSMICWADVPMAVAFAACSAC